MKTRNSEKGSVVVLVAILIPVILGSLALVLDNGRLQARKRHFQRVADAAAVAAAAELNAGNTTGYKAVALDYAKRNGFKDGAEQTIAINSPPTHGEHAGQTNFAEVVVTETPSNLFIRALGVDPPTVVARSVAAPLPDTNCWTLMNPSEKDAYSGGNSQVTLECGFNVNSSNSQAAKTKGFVKATTIGMTGDYSGTFLPTPITGLDPAPDPLADLPEVPYAGCDHTGRTKIKDATTINPGVYCGGLKISADTVVNPGIYIMAGGGLEVKKTAHLSGDDVMFYNTAGPGYKFKEVRFTSKSSATLTAPSSGTYQGVLFFEDRTIYKKNPNTFDNLENLYFDGALYFLKSEVRFKGKFKSKVPGTTEARMPMMLVSDKVKMKADVPLHITRPPEPYFPPLARIIAVAE